MLYPNGVVRVLIVDDDHEDFLLADDALIDSRYASFSTEWASSYQAGLAAIR